MKLIHCADLHLESSMRRNLTPDKAKKRKAELLVNFERMVEYGAHHQVDGILICGDLFDNKMVTLHTQQVVKECIERYPDMMFFYLKGNHDEGDTFLAGDLPENLKLFSQNWTSYSLQDVVITGIELTKENGELAPEKLMLNRTDCNLVMLHGQLEDYQGKDPAQTIVLSAYRNRNIDYMALGHIHSFQSGKLDNRGRYAYSGCLEGRGFDECGEKGFLMLTIEDGMITEEFIPFSMRQLYRVEVDLTGMTTNGEAVSLIREKLEGITQDSLVEVRLTGRLPLEHGINTTYLEEKLQGDYFVFRLKDETGIQMDLEQIMKDVSLKGEFLRLVMKETQDEILQKKLADTGLRALLGEEID